MGQPSGTPPGTAAGKPRRTMDQVQRGPATPTDNLLVDTLRHIYQLATRFYPYPPGITLNPVLTTALSNIAIGAETAVQSIAPSTLSPPSSPPPTLVTSTPSPSSPGPSTAPIPPKSST